jgi:hypothetical protein
MFHEQPFLNMKKVGRKANLLPPYSHQEQVPRIPYQQPARPDNLLPVHASRMTTLMMPTLYL